MRKKKSCDHECPALGQLCLQQPQRQVQTSAAETRSGPDDGETDELCQCVTCRSALLTSDSHCQLLTGTTVPLKKKKNVTSQSSLSAHHRKKVLITRNQSECEGVKGGSWDLKDWWVMTAVRCLTSCEY